MMLFPCEKPTLKREEITHAPSVTEATGSVHRIESSGKIRVVADGLGKDFHILVHRHEEACVD